MAGIYIHIPLCASRCTYCDFYSTNDFSLQEELVSCLCLELEQQQDYITDKQIETVYFGGGTPSLLTESNFKRIFETLNRIHDLSKCVEITLEANPDDLTEDYILMLRRFPFNRISIGIQSFIEKELQLINRRHSAQQAIDSVLLCQSLGFKNVSVDFIYGYPSQTVVDFEYNISKVLELNIQHVSAYHLTYEKGTVLYQKLQRKEIMLVDEETSLEMYQLLVKKLADADINQYEISNFARSGYESKHNSSYWSGKQYLGIGPSAHSYNGQNRKWNISSLKDYISAVKSSQNYSEIENLTIIDSYNDFIITSMRTVRGLNLTELKNKYGQDMLEYCLNSSKNHLKMNNLIIESDFLKCTQQGFLVSDGIMSDLIFIEE